MTPDEVLLGTHRLFLDTSPIIYLVEDHATYAAAIQRVLEHAAELGIMLVTSPVTLAECLQGALQASDSTIQEAFVSLIVHGPNTHFHVIDATTAIRAAELRVKHGLRLPDALQLASALATGCEALLTNDMQFNRVDDLKIVMVSELA